MRKNIFIDNVDFYPTPNEVIEKMMMGEDFIGKTILEPSAGKGNIVYWLNENGARNVIACEKDPNIRKLLNGKCEIIADDFLTVKGEDISHVDYIVMNPPFSEGAKHILHAFDIAPAGCTIIALCNSDSLSTGWQYNSTKEKLIETIELYGRSENLGDVFKSAERKTDVFISLVKLYKDGKGENEFSGYFFSQIDEDNAKSNEKEGIMQYNVIRDIVSRYVSAVKLFDDTLKAAQKINEIARFPEEGFEYIPIKFSTIKGGFNGTEVKTTHQQYKKALQKYYWRIIFSKLKMEKYATQTLREQINKFIEQQQNVPFTMHNIYRVIDIIIQTNGQRMNTSLLEAFDLICSFSYENSTAGEKWKTNANYMVNRKFIVPYMCNGYHDRYVYHDRGYCTKNGKKAYSYVKINGHNAYEMEDVCKALCYITGTDYDKVESLREHEDTEEWGTWFEWGFFRCKAFKKGTMHFEFIDEDVWHKFNLEVAKQRGWALPKKTTVI